MLRRRETLQGWAPPFILSRSFVYSNIACFTAIYDYDKASRHAKIRAREIGTDGMKDCGSKHFKAIFWWLYRKTLCEVVK